MVPSMSAGSESVSPSLPCVAGRLRLGPADARANQLAPGEARPRGKAGMYFRIRALDSEGYLTHQDSSEAPGAGRTASGFPPNGHSLATRRAYFEAGMLRQMNDMHGYRSPPTTRPTGGLRLLGAAAGVKGLRELAMLDLDTAPARDRRRVA